MKFIFCVLLVASGSSLFSQPLNPANIDIVRDEWGVPHIFAKTDAGVAYGLAWAHAEDDFKTIQQGFIAAKRCLDGTQASRGPRSTTLFIFCVAANWWITDMRKKFPLSTKLCFRATAMASTLTLGRIPGGAVKKNISRDTEGYANLLGIGIGDFVGRGSGPG